MADMTIGEAVLYLKGDDSALKKSLDGATKTAGASLEKLSKSLKSVGKQMTIIGGAATAAFGVAIKSAADFDKGMREVNTMMGLGSDEFKAFSGEVLALSSNLGVDAVESTGALYQAISAGVPKENVLTFLEVASKAAIGGVTSTETAVDGLTTVINAFGMDVSDASHVADVMFNTVKRGKTTFDELSGSMFNVAPIASTAGVSFEEVSAVLATLTKQGTPTSVATTQVRSAIVAMMKPTKDARKALEAMGIQYDENTLKQLGFAGTADLFMKAANGNTDTLARMMGSVEGLNAVLGVTGQQAEMFAEDVASMNDVLGASEAAFAEMEESTARKWARMQVAFQNLVIQIGTSLMPAFEQLLAAVTPIINAVSEWIQANPALAASLIGVVAGLSGLAAVLGPIVFTVGGIVGIFAKWKIASGAAALATKGVGDAAAAAVPLIGGGKGGLAFAIGSKSVGLFGALGLIAGAGAIGWAFGKMLYNWTEEGGAARRVLDSLGGGIYDLWEKIGGGPKSVEVNAKWKPRSEEGQEEIRRQQANRDFAAKGPEHLKATATEHFGVFAAIGKGLAQKTVDAFATGGVSRGGLALVGERGPELVNLPTGARVTPAHETRSAAGGVSIKVTMNGTTIRENADVDRIAKELGRRIDSRMIARGLRPVTI